MNAAGAPPRLRVLFDGQCGLCSHTVQFLFGHEDKAAFVFTPVQSPAGRILAHAAQINADDPSSFVVFDLAGHPRLKSDGAFYALQQCTAPWRVFAHVCQKLPRAWTDTVYDFVARRRIRFFGRTDVCAMAPEALRRRLETSAECLP
ncbi:MAG: DCC1-like thiol-disulfide oxidoreductase family protein [Hyphomicrobium sp.]